MRPKDQTNSPLTEYYWTSEKKTMHRDHKKDSKISDKNNCGVSITITSTFCSWAFSIFRLIVKHLITHVYYNITDELHKLIDKVEPGNSYIKVSNGGIHNSTEEMQLMSSCN